MKIIIDDKIPYIRGAFESFAKVLYLPGNKTTPEVVKDADAIITRTRTKCNKELLKNSSVKFIATATIGYDHIDTDYCRQAGIKWTNAPGCNAESVNQYIASALFSYSQKKGLALKTKTIGIIGVGHVGTKVAKLCKAIGMRVLLNDPPRQREEGGEQFTSIEKIKKEADIISFHVPLTHKGKDSTYHYANKKFIKSLKKHPLLINSCRGEVFDTQSIKNGLTSNDISGIIIDCWENEPNIDLELLNIADYGTPHIAGYSKDGKANGTQISVRAISKFFNLGIDNWEPKNVEEPKDKVICIDGTKKNKEAILAEAILKTYNIKNDDKRLRKKPQSFEKQRGEYPVRREFSNFYMKIKNIEEETQKKLRDLGFNIIQTEI